MALSASVDSRTATLREDEFLLFVGSRVRELRDRRGMTRKVLAGEAEVSERHLAQLESREGNISIVLLRRIAAVLNVSLSEIFGPSVAEPAERQTTRRLLERLPAHRLE